MLNVNYAKNANEHAAVETADKPLDAASHIELRTAQVDRLLEELKSSEPERDRALHEALLRAF